MYSEEEILLALKKLYGSDPFIRDLETGKIMAIVNDTDKMAYDSHRRLLKILREQKMKVWIPKP